MTFQKYKEFLEGLYPADKQTKDSKGSKQKKQSKKKEEEMEESDSEDEDEDVDKKKKKKKNVIGPVEEHDKRKSPITIESIREHHTGSL
jgi:hypothetical protein